MPLQKRIRRREDFLFRGFLEQQERSHFESHMLTFLVGVALKKKKKLVYSGIMEWLNVMVIKMSELSVMFNLHGVSWPV